jgi:Mor family transcriptional regulator
MSREICASCHKRNPLEFTVADDVWAAAVPSELQNKTLCIMCFDRWATRRGIDWSSGPIEWWPMSGVCATNELNIRDSEIGEAYERGMTAQEIAANSFVSTTQVYTILRRLGVARRRPGRAPRLEPTEREQEMIALYESGRTLAEVGLSFGITRERVRQILNKRGNGTRGPGGSWAKGQAAETDVKVRAAHSMGLNATEIQRATGLNQRTIYKSTIRQGLRPNRRALSQRVIKAMMLFDNGLSVAQIATELGYKNEKSLRTLLWRNGRYFTARAGGGGPA